MTSRPTLNLLFLTLVLSATVTADFCGPHCVTCETPQKCGMCLGYKMEPGTQTCSDDYPIPAEENCLAYVNFMGAEVCWVCKQGFTLDFIKGGCAPTQKTDSNCLTSMNLNGVDECMVCKGGVPAKLGGQCVSKDDLPEGYWKDNCVYGSGLFVEGEPDLIKCAVCEEGYTFVASKNQCVQGYNSCVFYDEDKDMCGCNVFDGYVQTGRASCAKDQ